MQLRQLKNTLLFVGGFHVLLLNPIYCVPLIWNVPETDSFFVNREEYLQNMEKLLDDSPLLLIIGVTGIGKTQLALRYAHQHYQEYDMVWWIDASANITAQFKELAFHWNLIQEKSGSAIEVDAVSDNRLLQIVKDQLRQTDKKWLLIFDNTQALGFIKKYLPKIGQNTQKHIIVTSQNSLLEGAMLKLGKFKRSESIDLLASVLKDDPLTKLDLLADRLGDYPYALSEFVKLLKIKPDMTIDEYIRIYLLKKMKQRGRNESILASRVFEDEDMITTAAIDVRLDKFQDSFPEAYEILLFTSHLNAGYISKNLLAKWADVRQSRDSIDILLAYINKFSFLEKNNLTKTEYYRIHEVIQYTMRSRLGENHHAFFKDALMAITQYYPCRFYEFSKFVQDNANDIFHLEKVLSVGKGNQCRTPEMFIVQLRLLEYYLYEKRDFAKSTEMLHKLSALLKQGLQVTPLVQAQYFIAKGSYEMWRNTNIKAAIAAYRQSLATLAGVDDCAEEMLRNYFNLAQAYFSQGDIGQCLKTCEMGKKLLARSGNILGQSVLYFIYARALLDNGDYELALKSIQTAIEKDQHQSVSKSDLFHFLVVKNIILLSLGRYLEAEAGFTAVKSQVQKYYGSSDNFLSASIDIARSDLYLRQGKNEAAMELLTKAKRTIDSCYPLQSHRDQAYACVVKGDIFLAKGLYAESYNEYLEAQKIYDRLFVKRESDTLYKLYEKLTVVGAHLNNQEIIRTYLRLIIDHFGFDHVRTKKIFNIMDKHAVVSEL
ncbi:MAG: hypothetical protein ABFQ95_05100 [Pseudomonadota bacterium]